MRRLILLSICFPLLFSACAPDEQVGSLCPEIGESTQTALFNAYKDQLIIPAYTTVYDRLESLEASLETLLANPNLTKLSEARDNFIAAYRAWQYAEPFYFGPAEDQLIEDHLNFFPIDPQALQVSIDTGFDEDATERYDRGFPAMDYLFYQGTDEAIIERLSDASVQAYLNANLDNMMNRLDLIIQDWNTAFGAAFVNNTGKVDGASLSQIINTYNRHFESIKRNRVGLASGILTLGFKDVEVLEGYYSGISLDLLSDAIDASSIYFYGGSKNDSLVSLYKLLSDLDLRVNNNLLANQMAASIEQYTAALEAIIIPLDEAILSEDEIIFGLYQALSGYVVLAKTDMPTLMCISITYVDNPSDSD